MGWISIVFPFTGSNRDHEYRRGAGWVDQSFGSHLAFLLVLQDHRDRAVGTRAEGQRPGAGGVQPFDAVAFAQAGDADAGAEPLFGVRPRTQHDLDQRRGIVADGGGLALDPLMRPVAIAPVRTRHMLSHCGGEIDPHAGRFDDPIPKDSRLIIRSGFAGWNLRQVPPSVTGIAIGSAAYVPRSTDIASQTF
jgi:hypothetical protein